MGNIDVMQKNILFIKTLYVIKIHVIGKNLHIAQFRGFIAKLLIYELICGILLLICV